MRHVQAQRLHDARLALLELAGQVLIGVRRVELPRVHQCGHVGDALVHFLRGDVLALAVALHYNALDLVGGVVRPQLYYVVGHVVDQMHRTGAGV